MEATARDHDATAENLGKAATAIEHARQEAEKVAQRVGDILNEASAKTPVAVEVDEATNQVIPPNTDYFDEDLTAQVAAKVQKLEADIAAVLADGQRVDADLAQAIATATGTSTPNPNAGTPGQNGKSKEGDTPHTEGGAAQTPAQANGHPPQQGVPSSPQEINTRIGNLGDGIDKAAATAGEHAAIPQQSAGLGPTQGQLNRAAARASEDLETISKFGKRLSVVGNVLEAANGVNEGVNEVKNGKSVGDAVVDVAPKTAGSIAGGMAGATLGAEYGAGIGATVGTVVPGLGTVAGGVVGAGVGAVVGGIAGSEVGKDMGEAVSKGWHAIFG